MKCLERSPARRYESARALSEDLQHFLDGEPIQAKRARLGTAVWKKARKHKLLTVLLGALLVGSFGLGAIWARAQRQVTEQARLARELGEGVKEMELFLRAAHALPVHDVERERGVVERGSGDRAAHGGGGPAGRGPGHYALGRGQLALGDPEQALEHLKQALAAGYSSADLNTRWGGRSGSCSGAPWRRRGGYQRGGAQAQGRELETRLRDPALVHLRAAVGSRIEVPAYAEGLIALYEGKNEEAIAKAKEAFAKAPWMYEPKKLEGDACTRKGAGTGTTRRLITRK